MPIIHYTLYIIIMENFLDQWQPYMDASDIQKLNTYLERTNNNLPNDTILMIIGPARTGKTTLMKQIVDFIGEPNIMNILDFKLSSQLPKMFLIGEQCKGKNKRLNQMVKNLISFKQSIIYTGIYWKGVFNQDINNNVCIIHMNHVF